MYLDIMSCVSHQAWRLISSIFSGVRQGENLSPILFSICLNDVEKNTCLKIQQKWYYMYSTCTIPNNNNENIVARVKIS